MWRARDEGTMTAFANNFIGIIFLVFVLAGEIAADDLEDVIYARSPVDGQNVTFVQAESLCQQYDPNGYLSNYSKLYEAWSDGLDLCYKGWVDTCELRSPIRFHRATCPLSTTLLGVKHGGTFCYPNLLKFGAFCVIRRKKQDLEKCPPGWRFWGATSRPTRGSCYRVFTGDTALRSSEAEARCQKHYAHLASIHDVSENDFVQELIVQNTASRVALIGLFSNGHGLAWYDGSPVASDVIQEFSDAPAGASFLVDKGTGVWEASDVGAPSWVCKRDPLLNIILSVADAEIIVGNKVTFTVEVRALDGTRIDDINLILEFGDGSKSTGPSHHHGRLIAYGLTYYRVQYTHRYSSPGTFTPKVELRTDHGIETAFLNASNSSSPARILVKEKHEDYFDLEVSPQVVQTGNIVNIKLRNRDGAALLNVKCTFNYGDGADEEFSWSMAGSQSVEKQYIFAPHIVGKVFVSVDCTDGLSIFTSSVSASVLQPVRGATILMPKESQSRVYQETLFGITCEGGYNVTYNISFGDGSEQVFHLSNTSCEEVQTPVRHVYKQTGSFTVVVKASNAVSQQTIQEDVVILDLPEPTISPVHAWSDIWNISTTLNPGSTATMSSTLVEGNTRFEASHALLNDVTYPCSCTMQEHNPWYRVELSATKYVAGVVLVNTVEKSERLRNVTITVDTPSTRAVCGHVLGGIGPNQTKAVWCDSPLIGNAVSIRIGSVGEQSDQLCLCKVIILESKKTRLEYGDQFGLPYGRIEYFQNGWKSVCKINEHALNVICRSLGFKVNHPRYFTLEKSSYDTGWPLIECRGNEDTLEQCTFSYESYNRPVRCDYVAAVDCAHADQAILTFPEGNTVNYYESQELCSLTPVQNLAFAVKHGLHVCTDNGEIVGGWLRGCSAYFPSHYPEQCGGSDINIKDYCSYSTVQLGVFCDEPRSYPETSHCPEGWEHMNQTSPRHCYRLFKSEVGVNFGEAEQLCKAEANGHLVSITSDDENHFLKQYLLRSNIGSVGALIGLTKQEGSLVWTDGTHVSLNLVEDGSNIGDSYVILDPFKDSWVVHSNNNEDVNYYICKTDQLPSFRISVQVHNAESSENQNMNTAKVGNDVGFSVLVYRLNGANYNSLDMKWDFGDDTIVNDIGSLLSFGLAEMRAEKYHTYTKSGKFQVKVHVVGKYKENFGTAEIVVVPVLNEIPLTLVPHEPVVSTQTGLATFEFQLPGNYGDPGVLQCEIQWSDNHQESMYISMKRHGSYLKSVPFNHTYDGVVGDVSVVSVCANNVSSTKLTTSIQLQMPVNVSMKLLTGMFYSVGGILKISCHCESGNSVTIYISYGDGNIAKHDNLNCNGKSVEFSHQYNSSGQFFIHCSASNNVSVHYEQLSVNVQEYLKDITVQVPTEPVASPPAYVAATANFVVADRTSSAWFGDVNVQWACGVDQPNGLSLAIESALTITSVGSDIDYNISKRLPIYLGHIVCKINFSNAISSMDVEGNIEIQQIITGPSAHFVNSHVATGVNNCLLIYMVTGNPVSIQVTFGNQLLANETIWFNNRGHQNKSVCHTSQKPGNYSTITKLWNDVTQTLTLKNTIRVQEPISDLKLQCPDIASIRAQEITCQLISNSGIKPASNVFCTLESDGIVVSDEYIGDLYNKTVEFSTNPSNKYILKATCKNLIGQKSATATVIGEDIIEDVALEISKTVASTNNAIDVCIKIGQGANMKISINFGDGTDKLLFQNFAEGDDSCTVTVSHVYRTPGLYSIVLTVENQVSKESSEEKIWIQNPITNAVIGVEKIVHIHELFTVIVTTTTAPAPTDVLCTVDFGDGNSEHLSGTNLTVHKAVIIKHKYAQHGNKIISVSCSNNISHVANQTEIQAMEPVDGLQITVTSNVVTLSDPVQFKLLLTAGFPVTINIHFGDGNSKTISCENNCIGPHAIDHVYLHEGKFSVHAEGFNVVSMQNVSLPLEIYVQNGVLGFSLEAEKKYIPNPPGLILYTLKYEQRLHHSPVSCVWDYGDNSETKTMNINLKDDDSTRHSHTVSGEFAGQIQTIVNCSNLVTNNVLALNLEVQHVFKDLQVITDNRTYNTSENVLFKLFYTGGSSANLMLDFGDGKESYKFVQLKEMEFVQFQHVYTTPGVHDPVLSASNNVSSEVVKVDPITVQIPIRGVTPSTSMNVVSVNEPFDICIKIDQGSNMNITVQFGDGKTNVQVVEMIDHSTSKYTATFKHIYNNFGIYDVAVSARNKVSLQSNSTQMQVQAPIDDIKIHAKNIILTHEPLSITIKTSTSPPPSDVTCTIDYGDGNAESINGHNLTLNRPLHVYHQYLEYTKGTISVNCSNNVSLANDQTFFTAMEKISGLHISASTNIVELSNSVQFEISLSTGAPAEINVNLGDDSIKTFTCIDNCTKAHSIYHTYPHEGIYEVIVEAVNALSNQNGTLKDNMIVQHGVLRIALDVDKTYIPNPPGLIAYTLKYEQRNHHSKISCLWNYGDNSENEIIEINLADGDSAHHNHTIQEDFAGQMLTFVNCSNLITNQVLSITLHVQHVCQDVQVVTNKQIFNTSEEVLFEISYTRGSSVRLVLDFGDGKETHKFVQSKDQKSIQFRHIYITPGVYEPVLSASNNVSAEVVKANPVTVQIPVHGITVVPSVNIAAVDQLVDVCVRMDQGSNMNITIQFGDGKSNVQVVETIDHSTDTCTATFKYFYQNFGIYDIVVSAHNKVSLQSNSAQMQVQAPIDDSKIYAQNIILTHEPLSITIKTSTSPPPSDVACTVDYGDGNAESINGHNLTLNRPLHVYYQYLEYTKGTISVNCSNNVSHANDQTDFTAMEKISGLHISASTNIVELSNSVQFEISLSTGAPAEINVYLGDDSINTFTCIDNCTKAHSIDHTYSHEGIYEVHVEAINALSSQNGTLKDNMIVQSGVLGLALDVDKKYIPNPPGLITYTLKYEQRNHHSKVSCLWKYGDNSESEIIEFNLADVDSTHHNHTIQEDFAGEMLTFVNCSNLITNQVLSVTLHVQHVFQDVQVVTNKQIFNTSEEVLFEISYTRGSSARLVLDFGDGKETQEFVPSKDTKSIQFQHVYTTPGVYEPVLSASNNVSSEVVKANPVAVQIPVHGVMVLPSVSIAAVDQLVTVCVRVDQGSNMNITIWYGDSTSSFQLVEAIGNGQSKCTITFNHVYSTVGDYDIIVKVSNKVSQQSNSNPLHIQSPIDNIQIDAQSIVLAHETMAFKITSSSASPPSDILCTVAFGSGSHEQINGQNLTYQTPLTVYHKYRHYEQAMISVNCSNNISYAIDQTEFIVMERISGLNISPSSTIVELSNSVQFEVSLSTGAPAEISVFFGDGSFETFFCKENCTQTHVIHHTYPHEGIYEVTGVAINALSGSNVTLEDNMIVQSGVLDLMLETEKKYIPNPPGLIRYTLKYEQRSHHSPIACSWDYGDDSKLDTVEFNMKDGTFNNHSHRVSSEFASSMHTVVNCSNLITYQILSVDVIIEHILAGIHMEVDNHVYNTSEEVFIRVYYSAGTSAKFVLNFGAGNKKEKFAPLLNGHLVFTHIYQKPGTFNPMLSAHNNVSSKTAVAEQVTVEEPVGNVTLVPSVKVATIDKAFELCVKVSQGSNITIEIHFGDGESEIQHSNSTVSYQESCATSFTYMYKEHGLYDITIIVTNQVSKSVVIEDIPVQSPINNIEIYAPSIVSTQELFSVQLTSATFPSPSAIQCEVSFGDGFKETVNGEKLADKASISVQHQYLQYGKKLIAVICSNNISQVVNYSEVSSVEKISGLKIQVSSNIVPLPSVTLFKVFMATGAPARIEVDFGDGTTGTISCTNECTDNHVLEHSYNHTGIFTVVATASNNVSVKNSTLNGKIFVQKEVLGLTLETPATFIPNPPGLISYRLKYDQRSHHSPLLCTWDYGDGSDMDIMDINLKDSSYTDHNHTVSEIFANKLQTVVNCSNLISHQVVAVSLEVQHVFEDLTVISDREIANTSESVSFQVNYKRGSVARLIIYFGDLTSSALFMWLKTDDIVPFHHTYIEPGVYIPYINATNDVSSEVVKGKPIIVQVPITDVEMNVTKYVKLSDGTVQVKMKSNQSPPPTNMSVKWFINDNIVKTMVIYQWLDNIHKDELRISSYRTGEYTVKVECSNFIGKPLSLYSKFTIEEAIQGLKIESVFESVAVGKETEFVIQFTQGSDIVLDVNFDDDSIISVIPDTSIKLSQVKHIFKEPGQYNVSVYGYNHVSGLRTSVAKPVIVQQMISDVTLIGPENVATDDAEVEFKVQIRGSSPTSDVNVLWSVDGGIQHQHIKSDSIKIDVSKRDYIGTHTVAAFVENAVSNNRTSYVFEVLEKLSRLELNMKSLTVKLYSLAHINVSVNSGSHMTIAISYGDGAKEELHPHYQSKFAEFSHNYTSDGIFELAVNVSNHYGWLTKSVAVLVAKSINSLTASPSKSAVSFSNHESELVTFAINSVDDIENANVTVDFGDGEISDFIWSTSTETLHLDHTFSKPGHFVITINASTPVNMISASTAVYVVEAINGLEIFVNDTHNKTFEGKRLPQFENGEQILVYVLYRSGTNITFEWLIDGDIQTVNTATGNKFVYTFLSFKTEGAHTIQVRAENMINSESTSTDVYIHNRPSIKQFNTPDDLVGFSNITYSIDLEYPLTHFCAAWGAGDGSSTVWYGQMCQKLMIGSSVELHDKNQSNIQILNHTHMYKTAGVFQVQVTIQTPISTLRINKSINIYLPCETPNIAFHGTQSAASLDNLPLYPQSNCFRIEPEAQSYCPPKDYVRYKWKIFRQDEVTKQYVQMREFNDTYLLRQRLQIPARSLDTGLYKATVNATVIPFLNVSSVASTYFRVTTSTLEVKIIGDIYRLYPETKDLVMDAVKGTVDPDADRFDKTGMKFQWFCRQLNETFPEENGKLKSDIPVSTARNEGGCFGNGPGRIPYNNGTFTIPAKRLKPGSYIFRVVVKKNVKENYFEQEVKITENLPMDISVQCGLNCHKEKVNPSGQLSRIGKCQNCQENEKLQWKWSLKRFEHSNELVDILDFENYTYTGLNSSSLVMKPNVLDGGYEYQLKVTARSVLDDIRSPGEEIENFKVNLPPFGGECNVYPKTGYALETNFTVVCRNWVDEGDRLRRNDSGCDDYPTYRVFYQEKGKTERKLLYIGDAKSPPMPLPFGLPEYNYMITLIVEIIDEFGELVTRNMDVQVKQKEYSPDELRSKFDDLTSGENSQIQKLLTSGDTQRAIQTVYAVLGFFAEDPKQNTSNSSSDGIPKAFKTEVRGNLVESLVTTYEHKTSTADVKQTFTVLKEVISAKDEVDDEAQIAASGGMKKMATNVALLNNTALEEFDSSFKDIRSTMGGLLVEKELPSADEEEKKKQAILGDYQLAQEKLSVSRFRKMLSGEPTFEVQDEKRPLMLKKGTPDQMKETNLKTKLGAVDFSSFDTSNVSSGSLGTQFSGFASNPFRNSNESDEKTPTTPIMSVQMFDDTGAKIKSSAQKGSGFELSLTLPSAPTANVFEFLYNESKSDMDWVFYIQFNVSSSSGLLKMNIKPITLNSTCQVFILEKRSLLGSQIMNTTLPKPNTEPKDMYTLHIPLENLEMGKMYYLGIVQNVSDTFVNSENTVQSTEEDGSDNSEHFSNTTTDTSQTQEFFTATEFSVSGQGSMRRRRSVNGYTSSPWTNTTSQFSFSSTVAPHSSNASTNTSAVNKTILYEVQIYELICQFYDEAQQVWHKAGDYCQVLESSSVEEVRFKSNLFGSFGASLFVAPNTIDFSTVFDNFGEKLLENAHVVATIFGFIGIYLILLIPVRRLDKRDQVKWAFNPLLDNHLSDKYKYRVSIHTGSQRSAGTKSKVYFIVTGEDADTGVRALDDGLRKNFEAGSISNFLMTSKHCLGDLLYLHIWHDNSGHGDHASWLLNKVDIQDMNDGKKYTFFCRDWLAVEEGDGKIDRVLAVAGQDQLEDPANNFGTHTKRSLTDQHVWLSVVYRPLPSQFTRVQRLSCCLALLFLAMISNAMWYRTDEKRETTTTITLGPITFTFHELYVSVMSSLTIMPATIAIMFLFRNSRPKPKKKKPEPVVILSDGRRKIKREKPNVSRRTKKRKPLPHWCIYIAWVLLVLSVVASAFFTILYSFEWGGEKSAQWLTSFLLSIVETILLMDPMKVIFLIAAALILRKVPEDDEYAEEDEEKSSSEEVYMVYEPKNEVRLMLPWTTINLQEHAFLGVSSTSLTEKHAGAYEGVQILRETFNDYDASGLVRRHEGAWRKKPETDLPKAPPKDSVYEKLHDEKELAECRARRMKEAHMFNTFRDVFSHVIFLFILLCIMYGNRDTVTFFMNKEIENTFAPSFNTIKNFDTFWEWMKTPLVNGLFSTTHYNGKPVSKEESKLMANMEALRMGQARIRQLQVNPGTCFPPRIVRLAGMHRCNEDYSSSAENTFNLTTYDDLDSLSKPAREAFAHHSSDELGGLGYYGKLGYYDASGFASNLGETSSQALEIIHDLQSQDWLGPYTRAVFVEFTVFTMNVNLFTSVKLVAEFPTLGGVHLTSNIESYRLYRYTGNLGVLALLSELVFVIYIIYFTVKEIRLLVKFKRDYFTESWHIADVLCVVLSWCAFGVYVKKIVLTMENVENVKNQRDKFVSFDELALYDTVFNFLFGVVVFVTQIRFLRLLRYQKSIALVKATMAILSENTRSFVIIYVMLFCAFVTLGVGLFVTYIQQFRHPFATATYLLSILIGGFKLHRLNGERSGLAVKLFFFFYQVIIFWVMTGLLISLIKVAINSAKEDLARNPDLDMFDYAWEKIMKILYGHRRRPKDGEEKKDDSNGRQQGSQWISAKEAKRFFFKSSKVTPIKTSQTNKDSKP